MQETVPKSNSLQLQPILFLTGIVSISFLPRVILSPLLPSIEENLGLSHTEAGGLFLLISLGYSLTALSSGFVSEKISHRGTIILSILSVGLAVIFVSSSSSLISIRISLFILGMGSGFYFTSAVATITSLADSKNWGKAIAIHEVGPSLSFVLAPILTELGLRFTSWRGILFANGIACLILGGLFALFGRGGEFPGQRPNLSNVRLIFSQPSFWIMVVIMSLASGVAIGVYSITPTYLISERGMEGGLVNLLVSVSRISGVFIIFLTGWLADRLGVKLLMVVTSGIAAVLTMLLGLAPNAWLAPVVLLQPASINAFFPVALIALSRIGPERARNVAISLTIPFVFMFGGGIVPAAMGVLGETGSFAIGFILMGGLLLVSLFSLRFLKYS